MMLDLHAIDWPETLERFGVDSHYLKNKQGPCPMHPESGKTKFRFDNKWGKGGWFCNDCGAGDGLTLLRLFTGLQDREVFAKLRELQQTGQTQPVQRPHQTPWCADEISDEEKAKRRARLQQAWRRSSAVKEDSPVLAYLQHRVPGLRIEWVSPLIRTARMSYFDEDGKDRGEFPVMLSKAIRSDGDKRVAATLHRTYLTPAGMKAPFEKVKKQMPSHVKLDGAAVRVNTAPDALKIYVCEGIETAFAIVAMTENRYPVYAALNAGNLANFRVPEFARRIMICADHDKPNSRGERVGIADARKLESRLAADGQAAVVHYPKTEGDDWNDAYLKRRAFSAKGEMEASPVEASKSARGLKGTERLAA